MTAVDKPALTGKRLIEDAIPIDAISRTSASEKVGHAASATPRQLHLWWARRPLAASRAAVYAALVPAEGQHRTPGGGGGVLRLALSLGRPGVGNPQGTRGGARRQRRPATRKWSTCSPAAGRSRSRPPGSAARSRRIELNPVAHLIERMMLEYPQAHPGLATTSVAGARSGSTAPGSNSPTFTHRSRTLAQWPTMTCSADVDGRPIAASPTCGRAPSAARTQRSASIVSIWSGRPGWARRRDARSHSSQSSTASALTVRYEVVEAATPSSSWIRPGAGSTRGQASCRVCGATVTG